MPQKSKGSPGRSVAASAPLGIKELLALFARDSIGGAPASFDHSSFFNDYGMDRNLKKRPDTQVTGGSGQNGGTPIAGGLGGPVAMLAPGAGVWITRTGSPVFPTKISVVATHVHNDVGGDDHDLTKTLEFSVPDVTSASPEWFVATVTVTVTGTFAAGMKLTAVVVMVGPGDAIRVQSKSGALA